MRLAVRVKSFLLAALLFVSTDAFGGWLPPALQTPTPVGNQSFATSPSMATYNGMTWIAYVSTTSNDILYITGSSNGTNWSTAQPFASVLPGTAPALAVFNNQLFVAWIDDGQGDSRIRGALYIGASMNPAVSGWDNASEYPRLITSNGSAFYPNGSPSMATVNSQLWITAVYNYKGSATTLETYTSADGLTFSAGFQCSSDDPLGYMPQVGAAAGMTAFKFPHTFLQTLVIAYQTQGGAGNHTLRVCWTTGSGGSYLTPAGSPQTGSGVSAMWDGTSLVFAFKNYSNNDLVLTGTTDGTNYNTLDYTGMEINGSGEINPSIADASFGDNYIAFTGTSGSHQGYVTH